MKHLILNLESPLMAFGRETIDNYGVIRWFPSASMLTGLFANALGWRRVDRERHQQLQDRLVFAARIDREPAGGVRMQDFQTVRIGEHVDLFQATDPKDKRRKYVVGWTTRGDPDFRGGDLGTDGFTHRRFRDYFADMRVTVALRLDPDAGSPTLDNLASALREPARPLFIGRKPCIPSTPLVGDKDEDIVEGDTALRALLGRTIYLDPDDTDPDDPVRLLWPDREGAEDVREDHSYTLTDERNWISGLHGGGRLVFEGTHPRKCFPAPKDAQEREEEQP